jgi:hypothetical protein
LDRVVCRIHNRQWQHRTGPCSFRLDAVWRTLFSSAGFEIVAERPLSRWRNLTHPVCRRFYVLKQVDTRRNAPERTPRPTLIARPKLSNYQVLQASARSNQNGT